MEELRNMEIKIFKKLQGIFLKCKVVELVLGKICAEESYFICE